MWRWPVGHVVTLKEGAPSPTKGTVTEGPTLAHLFAITSPLGGSKVWSCNCGAQHSQRALIIPISDFRFSYQNTLVLDC